MRSVGNFSYIINNSTPEGIIEIWDAEDSTREITEQIDPREFYTVSVFLESLRLDVYLPSFDKTSFPDIYPEDSYAERNSKLLEIEKKSPKTGLAFYRKIGDSASWIYLSEIVLQNRGRRTQIPVIVPYFTTNQLKMLHRRTRIGVQKITYGDGLIGGGPIADNHGIDKVQIEGDFRIDVDESEFHRRRWLNFQQKYTVRSSSPTLLIPYNPARAFFEIQNNGSRDLLLMFSETSNFNHAFTIKPGETYYPHSPVLIESIMGKSVLGETTVSVVETEYYLPR